MILYEQKWQKFLKRVWPFRFIPFVDFVLAAGSLATGNVREESDFDVIVGVRQKRIFIVRFFCFLTFNLFGWRARYPGKSKDRLCFNHFVAPAGYRLSPPHNIYWKNLYGNLVPVYGEPKKIQEFYDANADWMQFRRMYKSDKQHVYKRKGLIKRFCELLLGGKSGNWLEKILKKIQVVKIEKSLKSRDGCKPRIIYNDNELEFHPDTGRIEEFLNKN